jgi:DNA-binding NarL/FixJ family response regulator
MRFTVQVISSHAVFAASVAAALLQDVSLRRQISIRVTYWDAVYDSRDPALFLLDLCCPGPQPYALCKLLRLKHPACKFVCLISPEQAQEEYMLNLFFAGVEGIVCLKRRWRIQLRQAVRNVTDGELCIPAVVLQKYAQETKWLLEANNGLNRLLTAREIQVAHLALRQFSTRAIASELGISPRTVKFHVANIFLKTGARSCHQLTTTASLRKGNSTPAPSHECHLTLPCRSQGEPTESSTVAACPSDSQ